MTMAYHQYHGMQVRIARIFNTYGPRMRVHDGRAIPNFIDQSLRGKPLTIYGDGSQTRSFCYVDDLVEGLYRLLLSKLNEPVNLGNPHEMTLLELAESVRRLSRSKSRLVYRPLPQDDPRVRQPDIRLARQKLRWEPTVSFESGLKKTIAYFRQASRRP
jgi:dTDP-glucose 4,6-dehydratase